LIADVCEECVLARLKVEELELLQYKKAKIFVRKIAVTDSDKCQIQDAGRGSSTTVSEYKDDPMYQVGGRFSITDCTVQGLPLEVHSYSIDWMVIFWIVTLYISVVGYRRFGGTYRFHLYG
jgi:hypothetical protein